MEVNVAKTAGFCFGVKRAVDQVYEQTEKENGKKIYTYGPIIHNEEVVKDLRSRGVEVIHSEKELAALTEGIVIIRSHGVPKRIYDLLEEGSHVIIIGNPEHPEVQGIMGWSLLPVTVIQDAEEAEQLSLPEEQKICIVSQTTFNYNKFKDLVEIISKKRYDISVLNTICNATKERQTEAKSIAKGVDAMIVIGDKHSSNTQKLFEICKKACNNTYYIQTLDDLDMNQLRSVETVGITAGASTPNKIIEEVQKNVRINF